MVLTKFDPPVKILRVKSAIGNLKGQKVISRVKQTPCMFIDSLCGNLKGQKVISRVKQTPCMFIDSL
jgi:hypothetical protein